ncbi:MAG: hypothetical protein ACR2F6_07940 [Mycobacteriales bacterium]
MSRNKTLAPPPHIVWASLIDPHADPTRRWLILLHDEVEPRVLESTKAERVTWSSLWPDRPDDTIQLEVEPHRCGTRLRWTAYTPDVLPDDECRREIRYRLDKLLFGNLRDAYDQ